MQPSSEAIKSEASECAVRLLDAIPPAIWFIRRQMRRHWRGLSMPQFRALYFINANPTASLSAVAEHLGASLPSTSRLITGLQEQDLIERSGSKDDRRLLELLITPQGAEVMDSARAGTLTRLDEELAPLNDRQRALLEKAMVLLRDIFAPAGMVAGKVRVES
jgi:DNA-binding MarR family transcriptional regulator